MVRTTPAPTHGPQLLRAVRLVEMEGARPAEAAQQARAGTETVDAGTSVVTARDDEGNAVVVVHSNSFPTYGAGLVVEEFDLVLNNRPGRGFDLDAPPGSPNAPAAGRTPATTLHAWAVEKPEAIYLGATPGGENQMPWNLQTILECVDGEPDLGAVVAAPCWRLDGGDVWFEADHPGAGDPRGRTVPPFSLRSAQQIIRLGAGGHSSDVAADLRTGAGAATLGDPGGRTEAGG